VSIGIIVEYQVIEANNTQDLEGYVVDKMTHGWQPLGGVAYHYIHKDEYTPEVLLQAMVKYDW
jgi:hypothetical protein